MEKHVQTTCCKLKFLLENLECYDMQMKAYNSTQETRWQIRYANVTA